METKTIVTILVFPRINCFKTLTNMFSKCINNNFVSFVKKWFILISHLLLFTGVGVLIIITVENNKNNKNKLESFEFKLHKIFIILYVLQYFIIKQFSTCIFKSYYKFISKLTKSFLAFQYEFHFVEYHFFVWIISIDDKLMAHQFFATQHKNEFSTYDYKPRIILK